LTHSCEQLRYFIAFLFNNGIIVEKVAGGRLGVKINRQEFDSRYLERLNDHQRTAVQTIDGNVLLLATPGSGKTTVLVTRLGYMVCCLGIDPKHILTMTYTKAATSDMKARFTQLFGSEAANGLEFRTINGVSAKIISDYVRTYRRPGSPELQEDEKEIFAIIRQIYQTVNNEFAEESLLRDIKSGFTYVKNMMLSDAEIDRYQSGIDNFLELYRRYQAELQKRGIMDYDDQMVYAHKILCSKPDVLERFQNQFQYVCVDEAQDTSKIQHEIIKLLAAKCGNLFMVGDEDQSIYGFRAAYPEALLNFDSEHPDAKILLMEENYRSSPAIVNAANRFIAQNKARREKTIRATRNSERPVHMIQCKDRAAQYPILLELLQSPKADTAILFRNNDSALPLIDLFERNSISYNCKNIDGVFFTHRIVTDILDIIRFAYEPINSELFMRIYYKFDAKISKKAATEAIERSQGSGKPILEELMNRPDVKGYVRDSVIDLIDNLPEIKNDAAETAIRRIWETMHYGRYVKQKKLDEGKYFILCQLAKDIPSVQAFSDRLNDLRAIITSHKNSEKNKVLLSTIHSSKGLEYERVVMIDVFDGVLPSVSESNLQSADDEKLYEEERRLYYVAMTRAKDELYLFLPRDGSSFSREIQSYLPIPVYNENDVFSFLRASQIGKRYTDQMYGAGVVEAQCGDQLYVRFSDGGFHCLSLEEMVNRKEIPMVEAPAVRKTEQVKNKHAQIKPVSPVSKAPVHIGNGDTVHHNFFGEGVVQNIVGGIATIQFYNGMEKRLDLQLCLNKGLLYK